MLKTALRALVKKAKIEILCWEMMKSREFNFLKVKNCYFQCKTTIFGFLNKCPKGTC